jgi:glycosyltransferase involved in cell wall biosynthesis
MVSLVVITFNEEANISRCLQSAASLVDDVLVVDSHSTDQTVRIAESLGARVLLHAFEGYREQKDWAIQQARFDRVLVLDADEALSIDLQQQLTPLIQEWTHDGYFFNRLSRLSGRWIRHGAWYPDRKMRLFDRRCYQMAGENPHDRIDPTPGARTKRIEADILHYTNDSFDSRIDTINRFSRIAAEALFAKGIKGSLLRLLLKPPARFYSEYLWQGGFLDGFYGYFIARTSAQYVFYRESKLWELCRGTLAEPLNG